MVHSPSTSFRPLCLSDPEDTLLLLVKAVGTGITMVSYVPVFVVPDNLFSTCALIFWFTKSTSDKRQALVFGCSTYGEFKPLENPVRDAAALKDKLKLFGFKVICSKNPNRKTMIKKLVDFVDNLNDDTSDIVIYFAGHGCNIGEFLSDFLPSCWT